MTAAPNVRRELARLDAVSFRCGETLAVNAATCAFRAGEIHMVCGENGAGKTTLLKIASGMTTADSGVAIAFGSPLEPATPREAIRRGVAMVLQHFALVPVFTVLENIVLGWEKASAFGVLDDRAARAKLEQIARALGITLSLDARVESLSIGQRQWVEIARALYRDAELLILDEPTAVLTKSEASALYATLRRLANDGKGIVVVTHKMEEVRAHADVVSVMRRGELVFTRPIDRGGDVDAQIDVVTRAMMGTAVLREPQVDAEPVLGAPLVVLNDVDVGRALVGISLSVRAGEIVGIAGIEGNGQRELVALLAGSAAPSRGTVVLRPAAVIFDDRQSEGLVLDASVRENLVLGELARFSRSGLLDLTALETEAEARLERSGARTDLERPVRTLSGGNQQKIVVTRALSRKTDVIVAAQPTRGVDLAASIDIHQRLVSAAQRGAAVIVVSADLDELRTLASRILVLARGRLVAEFSPSATDEEIGRSMLGLSA